MPLMRASDLWGEHRFQRLAQGLDGAGGVGVSARFERILAFEFEQRGDLRQNFSDLIFVHWVKNKLEVARRKVGLCPIGQCVKDGG